MVLATSGRLSVLFAGTMGVEGFTSFSTSASLFHIFISLCRDIMAIVLIRFTFFLAPPGIRGPFHVVPRCGV